MLLFGSVVGLGAAGAPNLSQRAYPDATKIPSVFDKLATDGVRNIEPQTEHRRPGNDFANALARFRLRKGQGSGRA